MKKNFIFLVGLLCTAMAGFAQNPSIGGYNVYYGHIHNHCGYSDGTGSPDEAYDYAKSNSDMDFFGLSDHAEMLTSDEYADIISIADYYNEDGVFTTFYGFEWSSIVFGHVSVFNTSDYETSGWWIFGSFNSLLDWVNERDCIAFFNHPGSYNGWGKEFNHFSDTASDKFVGMELWNGDDAFDEYYYNDGYFDDDGDMGYYDEALTRGWKVGAGGSGDNHSDNWGNQNDYRLAILSDSLTRTNLTDAFSARRFFSTLDKNISMSFTMNGNEMGSTVDEGDLSVQIQLNDSDDEYFNEVQLFKNGAVIESWEIDEQEVDISITSSGVSNDYFYIKCLQADGDEAISSPIFVYGDSEESSSFAQVTDSEELKNTESMENSEEEIIAQEGISFVIYPNPAVDKAVSIRVNELTDYLQIVVSDINGRILLNEQIHETISSLPEFSPGVYFVKLTNMSSTNTQTLLVK